MIMGSISLVIFTNGVFEIPAVMNSREAEGWGGQADHHVQADQHAEMDHVDSQHPDYGYDHGKEHELQHRGVQNMAEDQKQGVYDQQQQVLVGGDTQDVLEIMAGIFSLATM